MVPGRWAGPRGRMQEKGGWVSFGSFRQQDEGLYDLAQSVADDLEEDEDGEEEEFSPVGDNSSPQEAQYSMPGGKKAIAILEQERIQAAGKGMKGSKIITSAGLKAPVMA